MPKAPQPVSAESAATQIAAFLARFDPPVRQLLQAARVEMRKRFPGAIEQVYDNYNFLVFGFGPTERTSEAIFSLAAYARGVNLFFLHGAKLADPDGVLHGGGKQVRFLPLDGAERLNDPAVAALMKAAIVQSPVPMPAAGGYTMVKSVSPKQRPRRPAKAATSETSPRTAAQKKPVPRPRA